MPYYHKLTGSMTDTLWDSHSMEVVNLQQFREHNTVRPELTPESCMRCVVAIVLADAIGNFLGKDYGAWEKDCMKWRGRILTGKFKHWCFEWDELPIDETCHEWPCGCGIEDEL